MKPIDNSFKYTTQKLPQLSFKGTNGVSPFAQEQIESVPQNIKRLLKDVKGCENYEKYQDTVQGWLEANPNVEKIDNHLYKSGEYYIKTSIMDFDAEYEKKVLAGLKKNGIGLIPEFITSSSTPEDFTVAVLKIEGTKNGGLIDYGQAVSIVSDEEKQSAYKDLMHLTKMGIVNTSIVNKNALKVTPDKPHKIVCTDWENLCQVEEYPAGGNTTPQFEVVNKIHKLIFGK